MHRLLSFKPYFLIVMTMVCLLTRNLVAESKETIDSDFNKNIIDISEVGTAEKITFGMSRKIDPDKVYEIQKQRGVIQTGLTPRFDKNCNCRPIDSEIWAKNYTQKRGKPALHKGIDIPAPRGTPVLAVADGTIVGKFLNEKNAKGIEIVLRHEPDDNGLPLWTYSQYTHLLDMPDLLIGTRVKMGNEIGKTSNTGISGKEAKEKNAGGISSSSGGKKRRYALHFAIFYSNFPTYAVSSYSIIPIEGFFMDPNAFYRKKPPYDSISMENLPEQEKQVSIPYMTEDGQFVPTDTKVIWPYSCRVR
ncbi:MAG: M23 family metallopeptidase [Proteobacteria bacterium]|nr:M23 family metallopeptidase [Pseudomonadota bacterium]